MHNINRFPIGCSKLLSQLDGCDAIAKFPVLVQEIPASCSSCLVLCQNRRLQPNTTRCHPMIFFMLRHCRHVGGQKQYMFSPLRKKIYFYAFLNTESRKSEGGEGGVYFTFFYKQLATQQNLLICIL